MFIIGERINSTRKRIKEALVSRDVAFLQGEAKKQVEAGAQAVDVNAAALVGQEVEALTWLVDIVQDVVSVPLCIDTPSVASARAALQRVKVRPAFINSISAESKRYADFLPLVKEFGTHVIALCADDKHGMARSLEDKLQIGLALVERLEKDGVPPENVYLDPLVFPVGTDSSVGKALLDAIHGFTQKIPSAHTEIGLSNVSYGLPERKLLNRTLLAMAIAAGLDSAILDPTDADLMAVLFAAEALSGRDEFCAQYIGAHRAGRLGVPQQP